MKLLDKLVLSDLVPAFLAGVLLFTVFYFVFGPTLLVARFLALGVPWSILMQIVFFSVTPVLAVTFPTGMLVATLLGYGRLSGDSETVALFAGGIPFLRIAAPAAVLGLAVSVLGFLISDKLAINDQYRFNTIVSDVKEKFAHEQSESANPFDFEFRQNGLLTQVHVERGFDSRAKAMREVTITLYDKTGVPTDIIHAGSAQYNGGDGKNWSLHDFSSWHLAPLASYASSPSINSNSTQLPAQIAQALAKTPSDLSLLQRDPDTLDFQQLRRQISLLQAAGQGDKPDTRYAETKLWAKLTFPLASLVFAVIGAPLGLRPQRTSKFTGWGLAIIIIGGYYVFYTIMSSIARGGGCPPLLAAALPDILGLAIGGFLIHRAQT